MESIVVGEIQKSYNAYAGILKRESVRCHHPAACHDQELTKIPSQQDTAHYAIEELRVGPIAMPKDHEWINFVQKDDQFVDPSIPIRSPQYIHYPGKDHYACQEIRAGLLERKTKYLKSYTAGWYVLSPTHLHEFKSADKTQTVMSLYLPEQKLGSHSHEAGSSPKFILKGRQTGGVHRGHSWVFRAESYDTMMAWYEDIKALTEKTPQERSEFVRGHSRSFSRTSSRRSVSSDGVVDEDDDEPYSAHNSAAALGPNPGFQQDVPRRPSPGGRFPSDIEVNAQRGLQAPLSPSSINDAAFHHRPQSDHDVIAAAGALPGSGFEQYYAPQTHPQSQNGYATYQPQAPQEIHSGTHNTQSSPAPYANHPAILMAARQRSAAENEEAMYQSGPGPNHHQEGAWLAGGPVETAPIPVGEVRNAPEPQPTSTATTNGGLYVTSGSGSGSNADPYAHATTNYGQHPRTTHVTTSVPMQQQQQQQTNGVGIGAETGRPALSERTESDAPTLSSEVPTISHLHVPGEYPKTNMI